MVTEVHSQIVPVVHWRMVAEQRIEKVPVTICRMVNEVVRIGFPDWSWNASPRPSSTSGPSSLARRSR